MRNSPIKSIKNPDKIKNYWIKEKKSVILLTLFGILYDVGMVARPIYQGKLIDALIAKVNFNNLIKLSLTFIFIIGMVQFFRYLKRYYVRQFANATTATMRFMIYNNILHKEERRELEQVSFSFQIPISLSILTHLTRHRMHSLLVPEFVPLWNFNNYVTPETIKAKMNDLYEKAIKKNIEIMEEFKNAGVAEEDLIYFYLVSL